jgi:hypothetical protein
MRAFEFINTVGPAERAGVKPYIARKANCERRLPQIEAYRRRTLPAPESLRYRGDTSTLTQDAPQSERPIEQSVGRQVLLIRSKEAQTALTLADNDIGPDDDKTTRTWPDEQTSDPITWIDTYASRVAARPRDSFWTMYSELNSGDQNLLQWCELTVSLPITTY